MKRGFLACTTLAASIALAGCETMGVMGDPQTTESARAFAEQHDQRLRPFLVSLYVGGEWNAVLSFEQLGLAAMELGYFRLAANSFDEAITRVEAIYADDPNAAKARSVFNEERVKDFKGEPYERAMLYYYRGLLYAHEGDYQNARAAFLAADRHDTLSSAEDEAFAGDFGMMKYLAGWASYCDDDPGRGQQLVSEAKAADSRIRVLPDKPAAHLALVDTGPAPVKYGAGKYSELLKFQSGGEYDANVRIVGADGVSTNEPFLPIGDLTYQASTRGGREVDAILAGKATFKDAAGAVSNAAMAVGSTMTMLGVSSGDNNMANAGLAGMLFSLVAAAAEASATPAADTRAWQSLPAAVLLAPAPGQTGTWQIETANAGKRPFVIDARHGACSVRWARTESALAKEHGGVVTFATTTGHEEGREERNKLFRTNLQSLQVAGVE